MLLPSDIIRKSDNTGAVILSVSVCLFCYMFMRMLLGMYVCTKSKLKRTFTHHIPMNA